MVAENAPKGLDLTHGIVPEEVREKVDPGSDPELAIRYWDALYKGRAKTCSLFLITKAELLELENPLQVLERDILEIFGKVPGMQNPPRITSAELDPLVGLVRDRNRRIAPNN